MVDPDGIVRGVKALDSDPLTTRFLRELFDEGGLPRARRTLDHDHAARTGGQAVDEVDVPAGRDRAGKESPDGAGYCRGGPRREAPGDERLRHLVEAAQVQGPGMDGHHLFVDEAGGGQVPVSPLVGLARKGAQSRDLVAVAADAFFVPVFAQVDDLVDGSGKSGIDGVRPRAVDDGDARLRKRHRVQRAGISRAVVMLDR